MEGNLGWRAGHGRCDGRSPAHVELVAEVLNGGHAVAPWILRDLAAVEANKANGVSSPYGTSIRTT